MTQQTLVAYFDDTPDAQRAADALASAGLSGDAVRIHTHTEGTTTHEEERKGFWDSITDFFMPNEDRSAYDEGVRRGGATLVARTDDANADRVAGILEDHGAVDVDEREANWRQESMTSGTAAAAAPSAALGAHESDETIPVAEENLRVGKRQVNEGRVRVRSYTVETPVEEDVSLRKESVNVERRATDHAVGDGDESLFRDRTVTAEEVNEEAVVAKETRVKEEVVINKDAVDDKQTIRDTVRHTEVDVEDDRETTRS